VEVVYQPCLLLWGAEFALYRIDGQGILYDLNEATALPGGQDFIRLEPQAQLLKLEYLVHLGNQLHGELLLADVVIRFHNDLQKSPGFQMPERRILPNSLILLSGNLLEYGILKRSIFVKVCIRFSELLSLDPSCKEKVLIFLNNHRLLFLLFWLLNYDGRLLKVDGFMSS
jgi:hypothetical protein